MNIQDIMRGLPFPVQGLLMQAYGMTGNQQPQQNAGGGRGFVNPPLVNPNAAPPQMPRVRPSRPVGVPKDEAGFEDVIARIMAGGSTDELQNAPAVEATPVQAAMQPDLPAPAAEETAATTPEPTPMQQAAGGAGSGILGYFDKAVGFSQPDFISRLGTALAVAGSQDPTKALMQVQQNRTEEDKIAEARRRANMPKIDQVPGTPFFMVTSPDGSTRMVKNDEIGKYLSDTNDAKVNAGVDRILLQGRVTQANQQAQADNKSGSDARSELTQVRETISAMEKGLEVANSQGRADQLIAIPGVAAAAEFFGAEGAAGNKVLQELKVNDALRLTAQTKGAISNTEMGLFLSPAPSPTADREKVWKPWIENKISVFKRLEKALEGSAARDVPPGANLPQPGGGASAPAAPSPAAPAAGSLSVPGLSPRASRYFQ